MEIFKNYNLDGLRSKDYLERLYALSFQNCATEIAKLDTYKKAEYAAEIDKKLVYMYTYVDVRYTDTFDANKKISPEAYINIMQRIKHWETILYYLYEINYLMEETELDEKIREAEAFLEKHDWSEKCERRRKQNDKMVKVNAVEEYNKLIGQRNARGKHTEEIIDMAKSLADKYFEG